MSTRSLTCVVKDGKYKVAQYGHWDGYPSGLGCDLLNFLKNYDIEKFKEKVNNCVLRTSEEFEEIIKKFSLFPSDEAYSEFLKQYPYLDDELSPYGILVAIYNSTNDVDLMNSLDFAKNGLFCEWAYVIDLDNNKFEVYTGFHQGDVPEDNRFGNEFNDDGYQPVALEKAYDLDNLPSNEEFINELEKE